MYELGLGLDLGFEGPGLGLEGPGLGLGLEGSGLGLVLEGPGLGLEGPGLVYIPVSVEPGEPIPYKAPLYQQQYQLIHKTPKNKFI